MNLSELRLPNRRDEHRPPNWPKRPFFVCEQRFQYTTSNLNPRSTWMMF